MNPLLVFFFISMMLDDLIFKGGNLIKYLIYTSLIYWVFCIFFPKTPYQTASKKLAIASYSQSYDPTIYTRMNLETKNAKLFLEKLEKETGKKYTLTLFFAKCAGEIYNKFPEINVSMRYGALFRKKTSDMAVLVDVDGKDLAVVTLRDIPNKKISQLSDELYKDAKSLKSGKNEKFKKETAQFKFLPSFLIALIVEIGGYLANLGINIKSLGIESNKFGSIIISSVGGFKLSTAYAPLCPFTYTSMIATLCSLKIKRTLNKDGSITEREVLPVHFAVDHRYVDGILGAKMMNEMRRVFENPEELKVI